MARRRYVSRKPVQTVSSFPGAAARPCGGASTPALAVSAPGTSGTSPAPVARASVVGAPEAFPAPFALALPPAEPLSPPVALAMPSGALLDGGLGALAIRRGAAVPPRLALWEPSCCADAASRTAFFTAMTWGSEPPGPAPRGTEAPAA